MSERLTHGYSASTKWRRRYLNLWTTDPEAGTLTTRPMQQALSHKTNLLRVQCVTTMYAVSHPLLVSVLPTPSTDDQRHLTLVLNLTILAYKKLIAIQRWSLFTHEENNY